MADGYLQPWTLRDHLAQFTHLSVAVGKGDGENHALPFHLMKQEHHLLIAERPAQQTVAGDGHAAESLCRQLACIADESWLEVIHHAEDEETVGIMLLNLVEIVVLYAVDEFLYYHGGRYLGIIHVRQEHFGAVPSVDHERGQHLHLFAEEECAAVVGSADDLSVPGRVLPEPQVAVGIDDKWLVFLCHSLFPCQLFFHLTRIWSPMMACTSRTSSSSSGSSM